MVYGRYFTNVGSWGLSWFFSTNVHITGALGPHPVIHHWGFLKLWEIPKSRGHPRRFVFFGWLRTPRTMINRSTINPTVIGTIIQSKILFPGYIYIYSTINIQSKILFPTIIIIFNNHHIPTDSFCCLNHLYIQKKSCHISCRKSTDRHWHSGDWKIRCNVKLLPSDNLTVCYWKWWFIVALPIENGDFP